MDDHGRSGDPEPHEVSGDPAAPRLRYRFAGFEYDTATGELIGPEGSVDIAPTPSALLELLLERPGEVVSRTSAWAEIWPEEVYDLDQKLNYAVHQLRRTLGDDASEPRFVQTLPRRGYRWVAKVEVVRAGLGAPAPGGPAHVSKRAAVAMGAAPPRWRGRAASLTVAALAASVIVVLALPAPEQPGAEDSVVASVESQVDAAALEAFRIGMHLLERGNDGDATLAESYFWKALDADETFASPWVGLAWLREDGGDRRMAAVLLDRAIALDPRNAQAHSTLGRYALDERRWDVSREHFLTAAASDPTDSGVHHQLSHRAAMLGDLEAAVEHIEEAMRINPGEAVAQGDAGWIYYWAGNPLRAIAECSRHQTIGGPSSMARACLMSAYLSLGEIDEVARMASEDMRLAGVWVDDGEQAPDEVLEGFYRWRLQELERLGASQYARARVAALMGDLEAALDYLEMSTASDEPSVRYALVEPIFRPLHQTSGFERVRDRLARPAGSLASR